MNKKLFFIVSLLAFLTGQDRQSIAHDRMEEPSHKERAELRHDHERSLSSNLVFEDRGRPDHADSSSTVNLDLSLFPSPEISGPGSQEESSQANPKRQRTVYPSSPSYMVSLLNHADALGRIAFYLREKDFSHLGRVSSSFRRWMAHARGTRMVTLNITSNPRIILNGLEALKRFQSVKCKIKIDSAASDFASIFWIINQIPNIQTFSIDRNRDFSLFDLNWEIFNLTEAILMSLERLTSLRHLWLGINMGTIKKERLARLSNLSQLETLFILDINEGALGCFLRNFPNLSQLEINSHVTESDFISITESLPGLSKLILTYKGSNEGLKSLSKLSKLTSLKLTCDEEDVKEGLRHLSSLPSLSSLDLTYNSWDDDNVMYPGLVYLGNLPNLTRLRLSCVNIDMVAANHLSFLTSLINLQSLKLDCWKVGCEAIVAFLPNLRNLQELDLGSGTFNNNNNDVFAAALGVMAGFPKLRYLGLSDFDVREPVPDALSRLTNLEKLSWKTEVEDPADPHLVHVALARLARLPKLRDLVFPAVTIDQKGIMLLSEFPALQKLYLNEMTPDAVKLLGKLTTLQSFRMTLPNSVYQRWVPEEPITEAMVFQLSSLPNLEELTFFMGEVTESKIASLARRTSLKRLTFMTRLRDKLFNVDDSVLLPLGALVHLQNLNLITPVPIRPSAIAPLQRALPNTHIKRMQGEVRN